MTCIVIFAHLLHLDLFGINLLQLDCDILHCCGSKNYTVPNVGEPHWPKIQRSVQYEEITYLSLLSFLDMCIFRWIQYELPFIYPGQVYIAQPTESVLGS